MIKEIREFFGYTQAELAEVCGVGLSSVKRWESPKVAMEPCGQALYRLCQMEFEMRQLQKQAERKKAS